MHQTIPVTVTGSSNAGVCIGFPNSIKIWIDLFPDVRTPLFSCLSDSEWESVKTDPRFSKPDLILFTHTHPDHFSSERVVEVNRLWPDVPVYLPAGSKWSRGPGIEELKVDLISGYEQEISVGDVKIDLLRTVHSGKEYRDIPHYSVFLQYEGKQIFVAGDALVTGEVMTNRLECTRTSLGIVTFPWASTSLGRERIEYSMQPEHLLLYHIPNEGEDRMNFRDAARNGKELVNCPDVRAFFEPLKEELFHL